MRAGFGKVLAMIFAAAAVPFFSSVACRSAGLKPDSVDILSGYGRARLKFQPEKYRLIPFYTSFNYDMGGPGSLLWKFCVEPFYSYAYTPRSGFESGADVALMYGLLRARPFQPYLKAGFGAIYISEKTLYQHNGFNFNEYVGLGLAFRPGERVGAVIEGRYRHVSNARLALPNVGIDMFLVLTGVSLRF